MKKADKTVKFETFNKKFPTNEKCLEKIRKIRWKNGFRCPRCNCYEAWEIAPYKYKCRNCGYQTSVTAGTIFHRTHLPMTKWFQAIYYLSVRRENATAIELQNVLGIGSNKTALSILSKIKPKAYCTTENRLDWKNNPLTGIVEVDKAEILLGQKAESILIAVENKSGAIGRIRISEYQKGKDEKRAVDRIIEKLIDEKATIRIRSCEISCPLAAKVNRDFRAWCEGKEKNGLTKLRSAYCRMINTYKTKVTFDELLKNILSNDAPPPYNSKLKK